jgi:hypothetical protein
VQRTPVGDLDQLLVGGEDGAEARHRRRREAGGHMHERVGVVRKAGRGTATYTGDEKVAL